MRRRGLFLGQFALPFLPKPVQARAALPAFAAGGRPVFAPSIIGETGPGLFVPDAASRAELMAMQRRLLAEIPALINQARRRAGA
jgi:hypothetical protein